MVEKSVKCYVGFLAGNSEETYHYLIEQHLDVLDTLGIIYLKIFENIDYSLCENYSQKLSPVPGAIAPYR